VQAGRRGHPILGDTLYGSTVGFGTQFDDPRLRAIALHARSLTFAHPTTQETVCVVAPASRDWHALGLKLD
jgi:23S rRNA pseudouridine1911/1915/1917 synthase